MKKLILMFFLAVAGTAMAQAQAQTAKACCAGKDKTACTKEGAAKAACCAKADKAGCAKMGTASADTGNATAVAGLTTETFKVFGNCGMCKRKIEGAASELEGVQYANWDVASKAMTVKYKPGAVQLEGIKAKIAAVGYDSETHRAPDEAYNSLHGCCQYERPKG